MARTKKRITQRIKKQNDFRFSNTTTKSCKWIWVLEENYSQFRFLNLKYKFSKNWSPMQSPSGCYWRKHCALNRKTWATRDKKSIAEERWSLQDREEPRLTSQIRLSKGKILNTSNVPECQETNKRFTQLATHLVVHLMISHRKQSKFKWWSDLRVGKYRMMEVESCRWREESFVLIAHKEKNKKLSVEAC